MHRFAHMQTKNMDLKELYEAGMRRRPKMYEILKMFSPHIFVGSAGRHDVDMYDQRGRLTDYQVLEKFFRRFPSLRLMPHTKVMTFKWGVNAPY